MTEIGIHLKDILVVALQGPFETGDIRRAKTELPTALQDKQAVTEFIVDQLLDNGCRSVGGAIVDDEDMKTFGQAEYGSDNLLDVFLLVVCRNDYNAVAFVHNLKLLRCKINKNM